MRITIVFLSLNFIVVSIFYSHGAQDAITIVPIADLVGASFQDQCSTQDAFLFYNMLPYCGKSSQDCARLHQLLFNERVTILEEKGNELLVQLPFVYYQLKGKQEQNNSFWTLKKNVITLDQLRLQGINLNYFPEPITTCPNKPTHSSVMTLTMPFWDPKTKKNYSAGTRFIYDKKYNNSLSYKVFIYNPQTRTITYVLIPKKIALIGIDSLSFEQKRNIFVSLLKQWARAQGIIPYVWGGCSYTIPCCDNNFSLINKKRNNKLCSYYERNSTGGNPKNGFDCTGLALRAAQIAGLPYYLKNSTTVEQNLQPLGEHDQIKNGDIIWFNGHIMVVSDVAQGTLIEARSYTHGFGKVQELPLQKVFKDIENFKQLKEAYLTKKPLYRLNNKFEVVQTIATFKILKLSSLAQ